MGDRIRVGRACIADVLNMQRAPDDTPAQLSAAIARVQQAQEACDELQESLGPLHEEAGQLLWLCNATQVRAAELEQRIGGFRSSLYAALKEVRTTDLKGAAALVLVLAYLCGSPRIAHLALDTNRNGKLSMSEFHSGLRLRLCLDYEEITQVNLRTLFKEFDSRKRGVLVEEDLAHCSPDLWEK